MTAAPKQLLAFGVLLEGCSYYACKDELKQDYVPKPGSTRWLDDRTLEVDFGDALRPPSEVDPQRFALLRYNVDIATGSDYYCYFTVCYRELSAFETIPESLSWDPAKPESLRLHFASPVSAGSCDPWRSPRDGKRTDFQALELVYLGVEADDYGDSDESGGVVVEPDALAYTTEIPIESFGPDVALQWLELCVPGGLCGLDEFCVPRGVWGYDFDHPGHPSNRWVGCP